MIINLLQSIELIGNIISPDARFLNRSSTFKNEIFENCLCSNNQTGEKNDTFCSAQNLDKYDFDNNCSYRESLYSSKVKSLIQIIEFENVRPVKYLPKIFHKWYVKKYLRDFAI